MNRMAVSSPRCAVLLSLLLAGVEACSLNPQALSDNSPAQGASYEPPNSSNEQGTGGAFVASGGNGGSPNVPAKTACGTGSCLPDERSACATYEPEAPVESSDDEEAPSGNSASDASPFFPGDAAPLVEADAASPAELADAANVPPSVDANFSRPNPPTATSEFSCQVLATEETVTRSCAPSGNQGIGQACNSSGDCAAGLGCVGAMRTGRCLPYCCANGDDDPCGENRYCTSRPLRAPAFREGEGPLIPVCDRIDNCDLAEPFPCPVGADCMCSEGEACTLIRPGTTSCEPPGTGGPGEACPCRAGHICSQSTATCLPLCELDRKPACPEGSLCQRSVALPEGWGTCTQEPG